MTVNDFVKKFTIDPISDIEPNFTLTKKIDTNTPSQKECFNCGDRANNMRLESVSWTGVQYCWRCRHLNVIYGQDAMGGGPNYDTVECYGEKK